MSGFAVAYKHLELYLKNTCTKKACYGLIIGQPHGANKYYVVHLAKTPSSTVVDGCEEIEEKVGESCPKDELDFHAIMTHAINVTRMIPGGFFVLGIFVVDEDDVFENERTLAKIKDGVKHLNGVLRRNQYFCGLPANKDDKLLLSFVSKTGTWKAKCYREKMDSLSPVEWKFAENITNWHIFESSYELDDVFPITGREEGTNLEHHLDESMNVIKDYIQNSEIFIQSEKLDDNMTLENYIKERIGKNENVELIKANIFLQETGPPLSTDVEKVEGTIRFSGIVASRIWAHPKNTMKDVQSFIRMDIIRSLAARVQIYCDSLSGGSGSHEVIHAADPPRRVFFAIPQSGGIQFSEYLFRNETPEVAAEQAEEILDININVDNVLTDKEGMPENDEMIAGLAEQIHYDKTYISKYMYMAGIATALLVIVASILLHFMFR